MASTPSPFAYYNEIDPCAAAWLRALIAEGALPDGEVDTRSVAEVAPEDLQGFRQCHFFAGIGGWAYALQLAEWPADRAVWTGSCPCQPFSSAGKQRGVADPRHLWPVWFRLIAQCRPPVVFGEQVEAAVAHGWLDLVYADLEGEGYAVGAAGLPAAGVGAPHLRGRVWFVADRSGERWERREGTAHGNVDDGADAGREQGDGGFERSGEAGVLGLAHLGEQRRQQDPRGAPRDEAADGRARRHGSQPDGDHQLGGDGENDDLGHPPRRGLRGDRRAPGSAGHPDQPVPASRVALPDGLLPGDGGLSRGGRLVQSAEDATAGAGVGVSAGLRQPRVSGSGGTEIPRTSEPSHASFWSPCDWLPCLDGKSRPVEPGTFPLAYGVPARVGRLRGYGNAIVPQVAEAFIRAYLA